MLPLSKNPYSPLNQLPRPTPMPVAGPTPSKAVRPTSPAPAQAPRPVAPVPAPTPAPAPVAPAPAAATPAAVYGPDLSTYTPTDPYDTALSDRVRDTKNTASQTVDERAIYRDKLKMYQKEIDAVNQLYREKLRMENVAGLGRLGTGRASQGRAGLLGSDFAAAQNDTIGQLNTDIRSGVQGEQALAIATILGQARKDATEEAATKRLAKEQGADAYLKFLGEQSTRRASKLESFLSTLGDTDLSKVSPTNLAEVAKSYGLTVDELKTRAKAAKDAAAAAAAKADLETRKSEADIAKIEADIAKGKLIELAEGGMLYNTETGETFKNPKTYAPKEGGGDVTPLNGTSPFVAQPNYSKLNASQKKQADSLNNLVRSLGEYKTYYNENPGIFGGRAGNMFGADAGTLETKLNSIIFAAAQAEGTGALQAADRAVIEKIVPNPTSLAGAYNTATKGGKAANIARIEDQIKKYTANLAGLGLAPVLDAPPAPYTAPTLGATLTSPDGTQEVDISSLTPAELQEAKDAGWR